jgi:NNP family nitrate/nitrite transporter-like MFS transporter
MALFFFTGVGNASTFQMIPVIMRKEIARLAPNEDAAEQRRRSDREAAAIIAFTSAIGGYGGFFIPKAYGSSIAMTGSAVPALWTFLAFYVLCLVVTWAVYVRRGGLLHDIERGRLAPVAVPAE